jgi:hypothetical protein
MRIQDLVFDVIVEEVKNKKLFNYLLDKWYGNTPSEQQINQCEEIIEDFNKIKDGLSLKKSQVHTFLTMFDGLHGSMKFNPNDLKDITKYSFEQILALIHEYDEEGENRETEENVFSGGDKKSTPERVEASKGLWEGEEYKIIDEGDLRVYAIPDQRVSMNYGYFEQFIARKQGGEQWCVTGRNSSDSRSNLWGSYRNRRTFYFVIDDTKDTSDKHYLGALQKTEGDSQTGFRLTNVRNDGDHALIWEDIVKIYPKLVEHRDLIVTVKYDEEGELENKDIVNRINETEGGKLEFRRMGRAYKKAYIERGSVISKARSWESIDRTLRNLYILTTTDRNAKDKFQTYELMSEIRKTGNEYNLLKNRLTQLGFNGVADIYENLMKTEFDVARTSIDNSTIKLYKSRRTHKMGLYNNSIADWVDVNGNKYEPNYSESDTSLYVDDEGNMYVVETFTTGGQPDHTSFYCVYPIVETNEMASGHFIDAQMFEQLLTKIHPKDEGEEDDDVVKISDFNPETDVNIKEMKKGL